MRISASRAGIPLLLLAGALQAGPALRARAEGFAGTVVIPGMSSDVELSSGSSAQEPEARVSAETEQKVRLFLHRFLDPAKTPQQQVSLFSDSADYYGRGAIGKTAMLRDVEHHVRQWPYRSYRLADISYLSADPLLDRVFVDYTVDFKLANASRTVAGTASYGAVIADLDSEPKIVSIEEKIDSRPTPAKRAAEPQAPPP